MLSVDALYDSATLAKVPDASALASPVSAFAPLPEFPHPAAMENANVAAKNRFIIFFFLMIDPPQTEYAAVSIF